MKKRTRMLCAAFAATFTAGSVAGLAACASDPVPLTDEPLKATLLADFTQGADARKEIFASGSKGYSWENGEPFNVWWKPENVTYENNKMQLAISEMTVKEQKWDEEKQENVDVVADYYGAETRTEHYYGFGDFQVRMKPSAVAGTASTFFTCTGPYDVWYEDDGETVKKTNNHDEIDIEFLGKDTTKVQFNYFAGGVGGHEYMYDLGFDASKDFHNYGFRWTESYITWFVDDTPVYRVDRPEEGGWPEDPGRVIMNYWCGTEAASAWMAPFADDYSGRAEYEWIKTSAKEQPDPNTAHVKPLPPVEITVPSEGWTDISIDDFDGWGSYAIDKTDGLTISHEEAKKDFACCGSTLADSYSWVKFTIKNNDENDANVRIDFKKEGKSGAVAAVVSECEGVTYNAVDAAVSANLGGGEEAEVAVKIKNTFIDQMVVFLNSMDSASSETGSITISELQGIFNTEVTPPDPVDPTPPTYEDGTAIDIAGFDGWGMYASDNTDGVINISHPTAKKATYNCCGMDLASDYSVIKFTIKNNAEVGAAVKLDIKKKGVADGDNGVGGVSEVEVTRGGGENNYAYANDYDASVVIIIDAGSELDITVTVKSDVAVNQFVVFLNSIDDEHCGDVGDITISKLRGTVKSSDPTPPVNPDPVDPDPVDPDPVPPAVTSFDVPTTGWEAVDDHLDGWEMYTLERTPFAYYNGVKVIKKTATSSCCGMDLEKKYSYFMFSIKNELGTPAEMRFDFKQKDIDGTGTVLAAMVNGKAVAIDAEAKAAPVTVPANAFVNVVIKLDSTLDMNQFVVFLNSLKEEGNPTDGTVVLTDFRGIAATPAETPDPSPAEGWTDIPLDAFAGWDMYEMDKTAGITISHEETRADYNCCGGDLAVNYSWVKFSVTNNGNETAMLRVDFKDKSKDSNPSYVSEVYPLNNVMRVAEGKEGKTSYSAGIIVEAGKTVDVVLKLDSKFFNQMVIFMNSLPAVGKASAGDVTITDLKGIVDPSIEHVDPNAQEVLDLNFGGHSKYTINKSGEGTNVKYSDVQLGSFVNMHARIEGVDAKKFNTLKMTVKNNGADNILLRVAICKYYDGNDNTKEDRNTCNTEQAINGPYYQDGRGGTYVVIPAGEEITVDFKYVPQGGERDPDEVYIYIDSSKKDDGKTCSGDITFKQFALANT